MFIQLKVETFSYFDQKRRTKINLKCFKRDSYITNRNVIVIFIDINNYEFKLEFCARNKMNINLILLNFLGF